MSETLRSDVLISGGGLVGQALALALAHHGLSVQIVDPADPVATIAPGFDGRASAIASATWQMFEVLGIADRLEIGRASCRERGVQYVEISVGAVTIKKKHKE